jgi:hypothetical protein
MKRQNWPGAARYVIEQLAEDVLKRSVRACGARYT